MNLNEKITNNINNVHLPAFVYRDTKHDFPSDVSENKSLTSQCLRLGAVALPFFSLHRPFGIAFTFIGNSLRFITCSKELSAAVNTREVIPVASSLAKTAVSAGALALMAISPVLSMAITTTQDIALHLGHLYTAYSANDNKKIFESFAHIFANAIYLGLFFTYSLELTLLAFSVQILLGLYQASEEFNKGKDHFLEGTAHLVMAAFRIHQMRPQLQMLQFKWELEKALANLPAENFVGELGENWEFPSDHLPIGATVNGKHIGSWNVLDRNYIDWVTDKNSQGIHGGMISRLNRESSVMKGLTVREVLIIHQILTMVERPNRPFKMLALQECNSLFIKGLQCMLPKHIDIVYQDRSLRRQDQEILLYNKNDFEFIPGESSTCITDAYPSAPGRPLMEAIFRDKQAGEKFQIFVGHIPGAPDLPARFEFAEYVVSHRKQDATTVALGDMNFNPIQMKEAFDKAKNKFLTFHEFENPIYYYTNIDPVSKAAKNIDQMWISAKDDMDVEIVGDLPDQVLPGLQETVNQLLPNSSHLEALYNQKKIDYIKFMTVRWRFYLERLKEWEKYSHLAVK
ncbi:MAG TPA: hypothetical protein VLG76_01680 [Rhabdochlamydiaceae bacterium]|nr:hypothetical protein [Rhabdochlamydiaceae bacterium]